MGEQIYHIADRLPADEAELRRLTDEINALEYGNYEMIEQQIELSRQFEEDDLVVQSGPRKGNPLSATGRRRRLLKLMELFYEGRVGFQRRMWLKRRREQVMRRTQADA